MNYVGPVRLRALIGTCNCIGRPIALLELRTVNANLVLKFDIEFADEGDGSEFIEKTTDLITLCLADLNLRFKRKT
jgi:tryprostatin B 6-hydroxylase